MEIIYEDNDIIVCYKPAGVATETNRIGQQDMVSLLRNYRVGRGEPPYIGMIHRLDQPVEGLLVFGKTKNAAAELSRQVAGRSLGKYYYAIGSCAAGNAADKLGCAENAGGEWTALTDYIVFDKKRNLSMIAESGAPQAKKAQLDYRVIGQLDGLVCFDIVLHTGRHHQIRLQMANRGFPLAGDRKYDSSAGISGRGEERTPQAGSRGAGQLALCSYRLIFTHPTTKREMDFDSSAQPGV